MSAKIISGKKYSVHVVGSKDQVKYLSHHDAEMDKRAVHAVKSAISKAKVCNKPIARYDAATKKTYVEYANGERKYVE